MIVPIVVSQFREGVVFNGSRSSVAPQINNRDVANIPDRRCKIKKRKGVGPYRRVVEILNGGLYEEHLHGKIIVKMLPN